MTTSTETTHLPFSELKAISRELLRLSDKPLFGFPPPFPYKAISKNLGDSLGIQDFKIDESDSGFKEPHEFLSPFSSPCLIQAVKSSLDGQAFLCVAQEDIKVFMSKVLGVDPNSSQFYSQEIVDSFFTFLGIETLSQVNSLCFNKMLPFKLSNEKDLPQDPSFCLDIWLEAFQERMLLRLIIPQTMRKSFKSFSLKTFGTQPSKEHLSSLNLTVQVEAGRSQFSLDAIHKLKLNDFLLIDSLYFDPEGEKSCYLSVHDFQLFYAQCENSSLKILEIPLHHEVQVAMVNKNNIPPPSSASNPEEDPPNEHSEKNAEGDEPVDMYPIDENEEPFADEAEEKEEVLSENEDPEEEDFDEDLELQENAPRMKEAVKAPASEIKPEHIEIPQATGVPLGKGEITLRDIPVTLVFELAQMTMNAQEMLELSPGSLLDLGTTPTSQVLLSVNGKVIGKGELLRVGDSLGVRILELG